MSDSGYEPQFPQGLPTSNPSNFTGIVTALFNMVRGQSSAQVQLTSIAASLAKLTGNIGANYSTQTFTPLLQFGGASTGITYSMQAGDVTIIGREIVARFALVLTSKGSATGSATIAGLPLTSNAGATNAGSGGGLTSYSNMSGLTGNPFGNVGTSSAIVSLFVFGAAAPAPLTDSNFTNTSAFAGLVQYYQ